MAEKENLSALFDGDTTDRRLIDALESDVSAQEAWKSFSVTRDVMRGDAPQSLNWDIAGSVAAALENEPTYSGETAENVVPMHVSQPTPEVARSGMPSWLQQMTQVGMAAAVSLAVIVGVQQYNGGSVTDPVLAGAQPPVLQTIPLSGSAEPVSLSREPLQSTSDEAQLMEQRRRVNAMFQDYELQLRLNADDIADKNDLLTPEVSIQD
ncbi:RseA family anti-sigma factor [Enterovibrio norvegicus]|uniref:Anti-sigma-E factor RseA n=1 Tax=Enterovibrio norvegicus TaxID=188144 RepID=A0A2N7LC74_9GAMM|nr:RseA family anti-sigma factor [Enterovibrio norvegicus]PML78199.1 anti-sigma E factor [Enterovibrio norvegicus]PMN69257.1 anti-sigma E factor [Enterovibrio norvegicus]PMN92917.1 anti-sigma E factor [Enterovibrio norvegicus]